jgi:hypothetical protein
LAAELNDKFGQGLASGLASVDANGNVTYKATPATQPTPAQVATANAVSSLPMIAIVVGVVVVALIALKK